MSENNQSLLALDIETSPAPGWESFDKAALDPNRSQVDLIALYNPSSSVVIDGVNTFTPTPDSRFITHGGKFDFKTLIIKRPDLYHADMYAHDTMLQAVAFSHKVPDYWLAKYSEKRKLINQALGSTVHRDAGKYSLKVLAPYFLGVEPFWEVANHNDKDYALKDAKYTYDLWQFFNSELKKEGSYDFYLKKLMPWGRMILEAEVAGVAIDTKLLDEKEKQAKEEMKEAELKLAIAWAPAFKAYYDKKVHQVESEYSSKKAQALAKLKPVVLKTRPEEAALRTAQKIQATAERYHQMREKAIAEIEPLNLASPTQLTWLLKDYLGLDITTFDEEDESTGKAVLERLKGEGRSDVATFLEYRKQSKLCTAFFPSYKEKMFNDRIYCNFNITGTRTGRLSSSGPNLQQVPGHLHPLFTGGAGRKIINYDLANIEPLLIAYLSEDHTLTDLMLQGKSFHDFNVSLIFGYSQVDKVAHKKERDACKEFGLSLLYGAYVNRMQESFAKRGFYFSIKQCKGFYRQFQEAFEGVFEYKRQVDGLLESGELVRNILGRVVTVGDNIKMTGFNTLVQGSASDLLLESGRKASERFKMEGLDAGIRLFVHDEVVAESSQSDAKRADEILREELTRWELPTSLGVIRTACEGGINDYWSK